MAPPIPKTSRQKSEFLTLNQDTIANWKPLPMTYNITNRDLRYADIAPLSTEGAKSRASGTIWAYHLATSQINLTPGQEKHCGCLTI